MRKMYFARSEPGSLDQPLSKASPRRADGEVDVLLARLRDLGEVRLVRGLDRRVPLAGQRLDLLSAHEEPVPLLEADDIARLGRGRVLPFERGRCGNAGLLEVGHQSTVG